MPAVNPARLKADINELAGYLDDPSRLTRQVVSLLKFYADYTRRPGSATGVDDAPWVLHVPAPIIREVQRALLRWLGDNPEQTREHSAALWAAGFRETQQIAAALLGEQKKEWVADWAETRARDCRDRPVLAELAAIGLKGWRSSDASGYLKRAETWLGDRNARMQAFALLALAEVPLESCAQLPEVFDILERYSWEARGETEKALRALLQRLAAASDRETAGFLLEQLAVRPERITPFLTSLHPYFSERHIHLFELAVTGSGDTS